MHWGFRVRGFLKRHLPSLIYVFLVGIFHSYELVRSSLYDFVRFSRFSRNFGESDREKLKASIVAHYHVLEKGLAMPERRSVFGTDVAESLFSKIRKWESRNYGEDPQIESALHVLRAYRSALGPVEFSKISKSGASSIFIADKVTHQHGGTRKLRASEVRQSCMGDFAELSESRYSVRNYSENPVSPDIIVRAVRIAQRSPSVCNRQSTKVFWTADKKKIQDLLSFQNGNRGFGHKTSILLIVTGDIRFFEGGGERSQLRTDGGMFSMSLLYALSYLGVGACPLNWSVGAVKDKALRRAASIPNSHEVIMMVSVGNLPEEFEVPYSRRNFVDEVIKSLDET